MRISIRVELQNPYPFAGTELFEEFWDILVYANFSEGLKRIAFPIYGENNVSYAFPVEFPYGLLYEGIRCRVRTAMWTPYGLALASEYLGLLVVV